MSDFGIDLGTSNTVVCQHRVGIVLDQPSVMVVRSGNHGRRMAPLLIGHEARALVGRCPDGLAVQRPLSDGVVTDLESARAFIVAALSRVGAHPWQPFRPRAVIGVPAGATVLERRALLEAAEEAGVRRARLVPEPIAGALGCGINPLGRRAHLVVDVGGGTAEVTAFCRGGILAQRSCRVAGDEMTLALYQYLRSEYQLVVGELTAEQVKCEIASEETGSLLTQGMDSATGRPRLVTLAVGEVLEALRPTLDPIMAMLAQCLEDLPPQAVSDIMEEGLWAFGGGALLRGFAGLLEDAFGFPVRLPARALPCVAEGAAACLSHREVLDAYDAELVAVA